MQIPTLLDMLKAGVHFGHITSKRHPKMAPFIFGVRSGVHIINLEETTKLLSDALSFVEGLAQKGGIILFVATKKQAQGIVRAAAESCGMPFMVDRWIGGFLTNFHEISRVIRHHKTLTDRFAEGVYNTISKKERLGFERELAKLEFMIGGVKQLTKAPDAMFVVDIKKEQTAVAEAIKVGIPIVAMVDTNVNPETITYPIPANDDATRSIALISNLIAEAVKSGKVLAETATVEEVTLSKAEEQEVAPTPK